MEVRGGSVEASMEFRGGLHGGSWSSMEASMEFRGGLHGGLRGVPDNLGHRLYVMTRHGCRGTRFRFIGVHHRQSMMLAGLHCQH